MSKDSIVEYEFSLFLSEDYFQSLFERTQEFPETVQ